MVSDRGVGGVLGEVAPSTLPHRENRLQLPKAADSGWRSRSACTLPGVSAEWFFSEDPGEVGLALTVCGECPVVGECGEERVLLNAPGVWGGVHWVMTTSAKTRPARTRRGLSRAVVEVGVNDTPFRRAQKLRRARVLTLRAEGLTLREMGRVLGVSHRTISNDLRVLGERS